MRYAEFIDSVEAASAAFARLIASVPGDTPVPTCPGWDLADLTEHMGGVHRWARGQITGTDDRDGGALPDGPAAAVDWFEAGSRALVDALRQRSPDAPCTTLYPPAVAATWARRQALETTLHLWDAATSAGSTIVIPTELAVDGVAEVTGDLYPRQVRLARIPPLGFRVEIRLLDDVSGAGEMFVLGGEDDGEDPRASIELRADDALLVLWKRRTLDSVVHRVVGDESALHAALATALVP